MKNADIPQVAVDQLREAYGQTAVEQLTGSLLEIKLTHYGSTKPRSLAYVVARSIKQERAGTPDGSTVMYIPGFAEKRVNKLSFAAEAAKQGLTFVLPNQDRGPMLRDPETGKKDATYTQAMNMLELYKSLKQQKSSAGDVRPVHIAAHSIGAQVASKMFEIALRTNQQELFEDADVFLLAPAGLFEQERVKDVTRRYLGMIASESDDGRQMLYPDKGGVTGKASLATLLENIPRTLSELRGLISEKVNLRAIADQSRQVTIMPYGEDRMFPLEQYAPAIETSIIHEDTAIANVSWLAPVFSHEGRFLGRSGATHDDEQYNAPRVIGAMYAVLEQREEFSAPLPPVSPAT